MLTNPGFETGTTDGWSGNASVTTNYQGYTAPDGSYFAVVLGGCPTNTLSQTFTASAGQTVTGWSFFKANDYSPFDDSGSVQLSVTGDGTTSTVFSSSVSQVGDYGGTPWEQWSYTAPADGQYTISATSNNSTDCINSSAVGLDLHAVGVAIAQPAAASYGATPTVTATESPAVPGSVQFSLNGTDYGSPVPVDPNGSATSAALTDGSGNPLTAGSYSIGATFTPTDTTTYNSAVAVPQTLTVNPAATQTTLAVPTGVVYGQSTTVSATESPAVPGSMDFTVDGNDIGSVAVDGNGSATSATISGLSVGSHDVVATFTPTDATNYAGSASPTESLTVSPVATQTTLAVPSGVVYGQSTTVTASESPAVPGSMDFTVDGNDVGSVAVDGSGSATSATISGLSVGSHDVVATFTPTDATDYTTSTSTTQSLVVAQADTTTSKPTISSTSVSTTVSPVAPGAGSPTGTVTFYSNGTQIGTAPVGVDGVATLTYSSHGTATIAASYGGDTNFTGSSNSTAVTNPTISATVSSAKPKTAYGWYSTPVAVTFSCTAGSQPLQSPCPSPVTLTSSGAAQSVTETVMGTDGGIATVTVSPINIDRVAPKVTIIGVRNGATYYGAVPRITCRATAGVSGLTPTGCRVTTSRSGSRVSYTATASSKAGVTTRVRGYVNVETVFVSGVPLRNGYYSLAKGRLYDLRAYATGKIAPVFLYAAPLGARPGSGHAAMTAIGHGLWQIKIALNRTPYSKWVMAVRIGRTTYLVRVLLY
ncbi:MAG: hypothetical protein NVS3B1_16420 [Marmoricola sp.]